jgi:hypothetical protein
MKNLYLILAVAVFMTGCTTAQNITKMDAGKVTNVCIAEHKEVRETVLETIEEGLTKHGVKYRVIPGSYVNTNNLWVPTFQTSDTAGCDAVLFYVANWNWDITMYMKFANIWMVTPDRKTKLGNANYDARASLNKFINAHNKIIELIDGIFDEYKSNDSPASVQPKQASMQAVPAAVAAPVPVATPATAPAPVAKASSAPVSSTSQKLRELQDLRKDGVISEADFQQKKKQLLEQM